METTVFFDLLLEELKQAEELRGYYRFLDDGAKYGFRKSYFMQRLDYIARHITDPNEVIWDCGSGYGTTCIYLAINGFKSHGSTLEYYYKALDQRRKYWQHHGDMSLFSSSYEDIYESHPEENSVDTILLQDTLHHLEPLQDALKIFNKVLKPGGRIILIEENGSNIIQNLKLYKQRGNKRIIEYYDETLKKNIIMGNENIRSLKKWKKEFARQGFVVDDPETEYIRFFPPFMFGKDDEDRLIARERKLVNRYGLLRNYFFFGINMIVRRV